MEQMRTVIQSSVLYRVLAAICAWFGVQWRRSGVIQWFIHPQEARARAETADSLFFRLGRRARAGLCRLYDRLRLERVFAGSVFLQTWLWCALPVAIAPLLPTAAVLALALVGCCCVALRLARARGRGALHAPVNRCLWLYALTYAVAIAASVSRKGSLMSGGLTIVFLLFALALENAVSTRRQLDTLLRALVFAASAVSLYGVLQYLFGWGYQSSAWVDSDMFSSISFRATSTLENPNMLGEYLVLMLPLGVAALLSAKTWGARAAYLGCCAVMGLCLVLTFSRGAWLAVLFAAFVFVVLLRPRLLLLAPLVLAAAYFVLPDTIVSRFTSIGNLTDRSSSYRLSIWLGSLAMLKDYWLCGIGPGTEAFNLVYPVYGYSAANAEHSHNLFLQITCDAGVTALVLFLLLLFHYFRDLCAAFCREADKTARLLQAAMVAGIAGFLVQGMTDYSFYNYRVTFLFWIYLALGAVVARRSALPEGGLWS